MALIGNDVFLALTMTWVRQRVRVWVRGHVRGDLYKLCDAQYGALVHNDKYHPMNAKQCCSMMRGAGGEGGQAKGAGERGV